MDTIDTINWDAHQDVCKWAGANLKYLASVAIQDRYIVNSTPETGYITPNDCLEDAFKILEFVDRKEMHHDRRMAQAFRDISVEKQSAIIRFAAVLREEKEHVYLSLSKSGGHSQNKEYIHGDPTWIRLRAAAMECIDVIGYELTGAFTEIASIEP